jgi:hypothetical protein
MIRFRSSVSFTTWLLTLIIISPITILLLNGLTGVTLATASPSLSYKAAAEIPKYNWSFWYFIILLDTFTRSPQATILIKPL